MIGWRQFLTEMGSDYPSESQLHGMRLRDQNALVESAKDLLLLKLAMRAFLSLQQVKLLRLQDEADEKLLDRMQGASLESATSLSWEPACSRAIANLGAALLESKCESVRFLGPQISPEATLRLQRVPLATLSAVAARLTSVDIDWHCTTDVTAYFTPLSSTFRHFFASAKSLIAIHLGFPAKLPLDSQLDHVFSGVEWNGLRTFSIQGWRLRSDEIVDFSLRHRRQLRELRLRNVYLRGGSRWRDVLLALRNEMEQLECLDLRGIDYASHFDSMAAANAVEGHENGNQTPDHYPVLGYDYLGRPWVLNGHALPLPEDMARALRALAVDDMGDNGISVGREQRSAWEAWVRASQRTVTRRRF